MTSIPTGTAPVRRTAGRRPAGRRAEVFAGLALGWAIAAALGLAVLPTGSSSTTTVSSDGYGIETSSHVSLLENEGSSVLVVLAIPALLALVAVVVRRRPVRATVAGLHLLLCVLGLMSIGLFFFPGAVLLVCAASATPGRARSLSTRTPAPGPPPPPPGPATR